MASQIRTLSNQLIDLIRNSILSGEVEPNIAIRQDTLAAKFGISKIPLREVLARLEEEGLLQSFANRGFFVREMSTAEAEEVFSLRARLEPNTMATAAKRATEADHKFAIETLATLDQVTDQHGAGVGAFNRAFHLALIRPSGLAVTTNILERLHVLSERYVRKHLEPLGRDKRANEDHRAMLEAWLQRDAKTVTQLAREHTKRTIEDLRVQLSSGSQ
jgi:DNA-binding GntR family transcriptional regulator